MMCFHVRRDLIQRAEDLAGPDAADARAANSVTGAASTQARMTRGSKEPSVRVAQPISSRSATTTNQLDMTSPASALRLVPFGGVPGKVSENTISARIR